MEIEDFEDSWIYMDNLISTELGILEDIRDSWLYFFNHHPEEHDDYKGKMLVG